MIVTYDWSKWQGAGRLIPDSARFLAQSITTAVKRSLNDWINKRLLRVTCKSQGTRNLMIKNCEVQKFSRLSIIFLLKQIPALNKMVIIASSTQLTPAWRDELFPRNFNYSLIDEFRRIIQVPQIEPACRTCWGFKALESKFSDFSIGDHKLFRLIIQFMQFGGKFSWYAVWCRSLLENHIWISDKVSEANLRSLSVSLCAWCCQNMQTVENCFVFGRSDILSTHIRRSRVKNENEEINQIDSCIDRHSKVFCF